MKKSKVVLLVEDENTLLRALKNKFVSAGYTVYGAANGQEGLALAQEVFPDLIVLDLVMPEMDGMALLRVLRESSWGTKIPVIILTNKDDVQSSVDAWSNNATLILIKSNHSLAEVVEYADQIISS